MSMNTYRSFRFLFFSTLLTFGSLLFGPLSNGAIAGKPAAKVNSCTIQAAQVNAISPNVGGQNAALESLINLQLFVDQAIREKLDQDPSVIDALETARKQILARTYTQKKIAQTPPPTPEAISDYYNQHPEFYSQRHIYQLQEMAIQALETQVPAIKKHFQGIKTLNDMAAWLKAEDIHFTVGAAVKAAEEFPTGLLPIVSKLKEGQTLSVKSKVGLTIIQLTGIQKDPLTIEQATPAIKKHLMNQSVGKTLRSLTNKLRENAEIEYFPPFTNLARSRN